MQNAEQDDNENNEGEKSHRSLFSEISDNNVDEEVSCNQFNGEIVNKEERTTVQQQSHISLGK